MLCNNGIVVAKHIFFFHVYGVENTQYLEHILFQEIHALFHTNYL